MRAPADSGKKLKLIFVSIFKSITQIKMQNTKIDFYFSILNIWQNAMNPHELYRMCDIPAWALKLQK